MKKIIKEQLEKVTVMNIDPTKIDKTFIIKKKLLYTNEK